MDTQFLSILREMFIHGEQGNSLMYCKYINSACGQLGLASMKDLPTDVEGYPY